MAADIFNKLSVNCFSNFWQRKKLIFTFALLTKRQCDMRREEEEKRNWILLEALFKRFYKPLRAYAFRFVNEKELAEDIVQDIFYELWHKRATVRFDDEAVRSYLFKAVYNHSLHLLNKKMQQNRTILTPESESQILDRYLAAHHFNSEQSLLLNELKEKISAYIDTLPPQCRKIFILSRAYELKNKEIAEQLNISIKAVEKQIGKALAGLKAYGREEGLFVLLLYLLLKP